MSFLTKSHFDFFTPFCFTVETENLRHEAYQGLPLTINKTLIPPKVDRVIYITQCKPKVIYYILNPLKRELKE